MNTRPSVRAPKQWAHINNARTKRKGETAMRRLNQCAPASPWYAWQGGQAMTELAIFAAVMLFCLTFFVRYAMQASYQQSGRMDTFRKAFIRAASREGSEFRPTRFDPGWDFENGDPPLPGDSWRSVAYTQIADKPAISAAEIVPIPERMTMGWSGEAVCSIDMYGQADSDDDLPRIEYEINGKRYSFTIADYGHYYGNGGGHWQRKESKTPSHLHDPAWRWVSVSSVEAGDMVDVDGDGYEERVIEKETDEDGNPTGHFTVLDYQNGEIDLTKSYGRATAGGKEIRGGLQPGWTRRTVVDGATPTLRRDETPAGIRITEDFHGGHTYERKIKRTRGNDYTVSTTVPVGHGGTWYTPH